MHGLFGEVYRGQTVLVTGHTGFKGSWLSLWLRELGAQVVGFSLPEPPTAPSNFELMGIGELLQDIRGDLRDADGLQDLLSKHRPAIVFHLAAQAIVLRSYREPRETMDVNAGGTVNLLEAIRGCDAVKAVVIITTDKVYDNQEWPWGYREVDPLGGLDPYSASKAMAEHAVAAYRHSFFHPDRHQEHGVAIATARAGNVVGGGDFSEDRLVPDCMRALLDNRPIGVRNPSSVRPWQHVLEPTSGYLQLGAELVRSGPKVGESWNFGPLEREGVTARDVAEELIRLWGHGTWEHTGQDDAPPERSQLRLSWEKAAKDLKWRPVYAWHEALAEVVAWFRAYSRSRDIGEVCRSHLQKYVEQARDLSLPWTEA